MRRNYNASARRWRRGRARYQAAHPRRAAATVFGQLYIGDTLIGGIQSIKLAPQPLPPSALHTALSTPLVYSGSVSSLRISPALLSQLLVS